MGWTDAEQLRVDPEAVGDHEDPVLVAGLRFAEVEGAGQGPGQCRGADVEVADLGVVRAFRRALAVEVRLGVRAGALAVGRVRVDREAFGKDQRRRADVEGEAAWLVEQRRFQLHVEAGGRVCLAGGQGRVEDRIEVLFLATGGRRVGGLGVRDGPDPGRSARRAWRQGLTGAGARVVGERLDGDAGGMWRAPFWDAQPALACCGQPAGEPAEPFGKRLSSFSPAAGKPQIVMAAEASGDRSG